MEKKTASTKSYNEKIKTPEYRMVNKKTYGAKKYYYSVVPVSKQGSGDEVEIIMKTGSKYIGQVNEKMKGMDLVDIM